MKDYANQVFLKKSYAEEHKEELAKMKAEDEENDRQFLVEQLKYSIIADLRLLSARIGTDAAKKFIGSEWYDLPF